MVFLSLLFLIFIGFLSYTLYTRDHTYWKNKGIPYYKANFLFGCIWAVLKGKRQISKQFGYLYHKYKNEPYFGTYILGKPFLFIRSPEIIKNMMIRDFHNFENRSFSSDKHAEMMSASSVVMLKNPEWRSARTKLTPIFTSGKLKLMVSLMKSCSKDLENYLEKKVDETVEIREIVDKYMCDVVPLCFFGFQTNTLKHGDSELRVNTSKMFKITLLRLISIISIFFAPKLVVWFKLKFLDTEYLEKVFNSTLKQREINQNSRNDFIDIMMKLKNNYECENKEFSNFDNSFILSNAITFYLASFETTSNALALTLYELCLNQDIQNKLRGEINAVLSTDEDITFENIQSIHYLDMVVNETLRKYPFALFLNRECKEDYVIKETGFKVEKGTPIIISIDGLHSDPDFYPEPDNFDPERFSAGYKSMLQSCTYLPFGNGPRNCLGDRFAMLCIKVGLIYFLRNYRLEKCSQTPETLILNPKSLFLKPLNGLHMTVRKVPN